MRSLCALLLLANAVLGLADTLTLKDGRTVSGTYLGGTSRQVKMETYDRVESYDVTDVARIEFQAPAPPPPPAAAAAPAPRERVRLMRPETAAAAPAPASEARYFTIPAGTVLNVRMIDGVDSEVSQVGQTFQASLDDPIMVDGETAVPRGADVVAKLVEDKQSGKISGRTELTLDLVSIRVNGRTVDLNTEEVKTSSESRTAKSGKVVGGTAAVGAILGGIFGGGKGAAIGAVSGAGAGAAVQVLTKGQRVKIPAETRLSFTLQNATKI